MRDVNHSNTETIDTEDQVSFPSIDRSLWVCMTPKFDASCSPECLRLSRVEVQQGCTALHPSRSSYEKHTVASVFHGHKLITSIGRLKPRLMHYHCGH